MNREVDMHVHLRMAFSTKTCSLVPCPVIQQRGNRDDPWMVETATGVRGSIAQSDTEGVHLQTSDSRMYEDRVS